MQRFRKTVFWAAILTAVLLLIAPFVLKALHLEFASNGDEATFDGIRFLGVPIAAMLTLTGTIKPGDVKGTVIGKVVLTLIAVFVFVVVTTTTALDGICSHTTDKILFINLADTSIKIASRDYDCGTFDRLVPIYHTVKIINYTPYLVKASPIDTTGLDRKEWYKVEDTSK